GSRSSAWLCAAGFPRKTASSALRAFGLLKRRFVPAAPFRPCSSASPANAITNASPPLLIGPKWLFPSSVPRIASLKASPTPSTRKEWPRWYILGRLRSMISCAFRLLPALPFSSSSQVCRIPAMWERFCALLRPLARREPPPPLLASAAPQTRSRRNRAWCRRADPHSHDRWRRITERGRCCCRRFLRSRATKKLRACVGHPNVCSFAVIQNVGHPAAVRKTVSLFSKLPLSAEPDVPAANQPLA